MGAQSLGLIANCPFLHGRDTETIVNDSNSHHLWLTVNQIRSGQENAFECADTFQCDFVLS